MDRICRTPRPKLAGKNIMNQHPTQMSFEEALTCRSQSHRQPRRPARPGRARWWFNQMRHVVDAAFDWQPAPPARPEQIYLTLARRR